MVKEHIPASEVTPTHFASLHIKELHRNIIEDVVYDSVFKLRCTFYDKLGSLTQVLTRSVTACHASTELLKVRPYIVSAKDGRWSLNGLKMTDISLVDTTFRLIKCSTWVGVRPDMNM